MVIWEFRFKDYHWEPVASPSVCKRLAAEPLFQIERQKTLIVVDILTPTFLVLCHKFTTAEKKKKIFFIRYFAIEFYVNIFTLW